MYVFVTEYIEMKSNEDAFGFLKLNSMFQIGENVICINNSMQTHTIEELTKDMPNWVRKDEKYTIRGFTINNGIVDGVCLKKLKMIINFLD